MDPTHTRPVLPLDRPVPGWDRLCQNSSALLFSPRVDKKRDKIERKILDSQERAFWDVHRPVVGEAVFFIIIKIIKRYFFCKCNRPEAAKPSHLKGAGSNHGCFLHEICLLFVFPAAELVNTLNPRMWIWPPHKCHIDNCHSTSASELLSSLIIHTCSASAITFPHRSEACSLKVAAQS